METNQYYVYEYTRKSPYIDKEEQLIITSTLIKGTSRDNPIRLITYKSELEEFYKLILLITLSSKEIIEEVSQELANTTNKIVKYNNTYYKPFNFQTKLGREVGAHNLDNNSNRISSINKGTLEREIKDPRDNCLAKIAYHPIDYSFNKVLTSKDTYNYLVKLINNNKKKIKYSYLKEYHRLSKIYSSIIIKEVLASIKVILKLEESINSNKDNYYLVVIKKGTIRFTKATKKTKVNKNEILISSSLSFSDFKNLIKLITLREA